MNIITKSFERIRAGLSWRAGAASAKMHDARISLETRFRKTFGVEEPEEKIISDSQKFWADSSHEKYAQNSHWRGGGIFADESKWLAMGEEHLRFFEACAEMVNFRRPMTRIVEWGCGGGMNAVRFAPLANEFCGIDISQPSLDECARQMKLAGLNNFAPVLLEASDPDAVLQRVAGQSDLFLCTYVFEILPSPEYGFRLLKLANQLLVPGGMAIVQVKYADDWTTISRTWNYAKNISWNATYRIEEFWKKAQDCGFMPQFVKLVPRQEQINDRNYAYFFLLKPDSRSR